MGLNEISNDVISGCRVVYSLSEQVRPSVPCMHTQDVGVSESLNTSVNKGKKKLYGCDSLLCSSKLPVYELNIS